MLHAEHLLHGRQQGVYTYSKGTDTRFALINTSAEMTIGTRSRSDAIEGAARNV